MRCFTAADRGRHHIEKRTVFCRYIRYPAIGCSGVYITGRTVRIGNFPYVVVDFNSFYPFIYTAKDTFNAQAANIF